MVSSHVQWTTTSPLWAGLGSRSATEGGRAFREPVLLRFATDSFMEQLISLLDNQPERLGEWRAQAETWRGPTAEQPPIALAQMQAGALERVRLAIRDARTPLPLAVPAPLEAIAAAPVISAPAAPALPMKLYQPGHQRFYLIGASLICREPGLPERAIDSGAGERATFVVRRLRPPADDYSVPSTVEECDEYAYVTSDSKPAWHKVDVRESLTPGEEQTPLFGLNFAGEAGRKRRLLAGLAPIGKREAYVGAPIKQHDPGGPGGGTGAGSEQPPDPRKTLLQMEVTGPWKSALERSFSARAALSRATGDHDPRVAAATSIVKDAREQIQSASWYALLDLSDYLERYLPLVLQAAKDPSQVSTLDQGQAALLHLLDAWPILHPALTDPALPDSPEATNLLGYDRPPNPHTLRAAVARIGDYRNQLEQVSKPYQRTVGFSSDWPAFLFPLADPLIPSISPDPTTLRAEQEAMFTQVDGLETAIMAALPEPGQGAGQQAPPPLVAGVPVLDARHGWFVVRCVFERPQCGPVPLPLVSAPTRPFQMASFFDPDAPARPIRISLPFDTSPAGLRKFDKNTALVISDMLCGQIARVKGLTFGDLILAALPPPFHKDLPIGPEGPCDMGMICSISIPIVTICALILVMIIVSLLDLIFHWVPYFLLCFPVPNLKSKEPS